MNHTMLTPDLMEVRGAQSEIGASLYAQQTTGRIVESIIHVAHTVYQVALR